MEKQCARGVIEVLARHRQCFAHLTPDFPLEIVFPTWWWQEEMPLSVLFGLCVPAERWVLFDEDAEQESGQFQHLLLACARATGGDWIVQDVKEQWEQQEHGWCQTISFVSWGQPFAFSLSTPDIGSLPVLIDQIRDFARTHLPGNFVLLHAEDRYVRIVYLSNEVIADLSACLKSHPATLARFNEQLGLDLPECRQKERETPLSENASESLLVVMHEGVS